MSDPVTNVEIEDVLSSIRKLVADDARVAPSSPKKEPERLVLTPAQRVKEAPKPEKFATVRTSEAEVVAEPTPAEKQDFPNDLPIEAVPGDARLSDFGEVEGAFPDLDAVTEPDDPDVADPELGNEVVQSGARLELGRLIEQEVAAALKDVPVSGDLSDSEDDELSDDTDWSASPEDHDDEETAPVVSSDSEMVDVSEHYIDEAQSHDAEAVSNGDVSDLETHHVHVPPPPLTLEDKVAALGRLVARDTNEFEEERDNPDADDLTAVAERMNWPEVVLVEDAPEVAEEAASNVLRSETAWQVPVDPLELNEDVQPEPEPEPQVEASVDTEIAVSQPLPAQQPSLQLDEDMLRELVSDIVRQELQGALGERITRNVRKLVRREIHRMLISQEME